ncbi:hypothetical protein [Chryseobacterium echinoideorum]|uniref:hypothetical protein n=1 Tax=Chryseobacterium echinoideorum TaxID=1549648 RepID=UPI001186DB3B|nr:hypothetical protein [Chryseobacterium echinoideorum]
MMRKISFLMLFALLFLVLSCRTESFNQEDPKIQDYSNSILKVSLEEVLSKTSKFDKEITHDLSTFTWEKRLENKNTEKNTEDNNYYFNTDDIQKITAENATYYTIPAISKTDEREDILHSLSLRISDEGLQSRMVTVQLKDDESLEIVSSVPYNYDPQSVTAREDAECTTYLITGPCSCHETHAAGGCTHPIQIMLTQCGTGSGSGTVTSGSTYYTGTPTANFPSNSSGTYVYSTADQVYNSLRIKLKPDYFLTNIQKFKILESPHLASQIVTFLNQNPQHKAAAISFINSIGPISTAQEMQTAISNYINGFNFNSGLSSAQNTWKAQNPALFDKILAYILLDYPNRKDFGYWGINFLIQNPTTTWEEFQNWFIDGNLDYQNIADVEFAKDLSLLSYDLVIANQNGTLNQLQTSWPNWQKVKQKIKSSIAQGVHQTAKVVKTFYDEVSSNPYTNNTGTRVLLNIFIDELRNEIKQTTNMNKDTMNWQDLFNIWLFELMPNPNSSINFTWSSNVINGNTLYNANTNAVYKFPKGNPDMMNDIKSGLNNGTLNVGNSMSKYFGITLHNIMQHFPIITLVYKCLGLMILKQLLFLNLEMLR